MSNPDPPPATGASFESRSDHHKPSKWIISLTIGLLLAIQVGNYIATASLFALLRENPLLLMLLQPTTKNLLLVKATGAIAIGTFFAVAILRRQVPHVPWFFIGRWYGDSGIAWVKKRSFELGSLIETLEEWFPKYGRLIVLLYPHPVVCAMAGASAMRFGTFLVWTFAGIIGYVTAAWYFGNWAAPVLEPITNFGTEHWKPLTAITVALVIISFWKAQKSEDHRIESIHELEEELERGDNPDPNKPD